MRVSGAGVFERCVNRQYICMYIWHNNVLSAKYGALLNEELLYKTIINREENFIIYKRLRLATHITYRYLESNENIEMSVDRRGL